MLVDQRTNSLSLVEVHEQFRTPSLPFVLPQISIVWLTKKSPSDPDEFEAELECLLNKKEVGKFPVRLNFSGQNMARSIAVLGGLVVTDPGSLEFRIKVENKTYASQKLPVTLIKGDVEVIEGHE